MPEPNLSENVPEVLPLTEAATFFDVDAKRLRRIVDAHRKHYGPVAGSRQAKIQTATGERFPIAYPIAFLRELIESDKAKGKLPANIPDSSTGKMPEPIQDHPQTSGENVPGNVYEKLFDRERNLYEERIAELLRALDEERSTKAALLSMMEKQQQIVLDTRKELGEVTALKAIAPMQESTPDARTDAQAEPRQDYVTENSSTEPKPLSWRERLRRFLDR